MILPDVNILVYAFREDAVDHKKYQNWLESYLNGDETYGMSELVLSGFLRVVTHPRIFSVPTPIEMALKFTTQLKEQVHCTMISPTMRHWEIFEKLCRTCKVKGNLVPDAYFAALAIESGSEWITTDRDYSRFPGLRWRHPFEN